MNKTMTKGYDQLIIELARTPKVNVQAFNRKYEEVIRAFLDCKEIYTIATSNSPIERVKNNTAAVFSGINSKKVPCYWLFSSRYIAEDFADRCNLVKDGVRFIRRLTGDELLALLNHGIFKGIYQVIIDENKISLTTSAYDVFNVALEKRGYQKLLLRREYNVMALFNNMKYNKKKMFAIPTDNETEDGKVVFAADRENILNIFDNKEDADIHKYDIGYGRKDSLELDLNGLKDGVELAVKNGVEELKFEFDEIVVNMNSKKALYILTQMTK